MKKLLIFALSVALSTSLFAMLDNDDVSFIKKPWKEIQRMKDWEKQKQSQNQTSNKADPAAAGLAQIDSLRTAQEKQLQELKTAANLPATPCPAELPSSPSAQDLVPTTKRGVCDVAKDLQKAFMTVQDEAE